MSFFNIQFYPAMNELLAKIGEAGTISFMQVPSKKWMEADLRNTEAGQYRGKLTEEGVRMFLL
jgi:hypothetical protein